MPCNSLIQTILIDINTIQKAADALGITVIKRTNNSYTLRKGDEQVTIERTREGEKFSTALYSANGDLLASLVPAYAKERVKQFAKSKGYTVSAGSKPNTFVLTKYG